MEILSLVESIRAEEASVQRLFRGDGAPIRGRNTSPRYLTKLAEVATFLESVLAGRTPAYYLQEAMTTSDFPLLFGDILDRQVLASYQEWPLTWTSVARRGTVRDFRQAKLIPPVLGGDSRLPKVAEATTYPAVSVSEQEHLTRQVFKWGRTIPFSWEAMVNDDLDQLKDMPARLARAARRTEEREVTDLYADANGPHASLYTSGNANIVNSTNAPGFAATNPALSIGALQQAMAVLANQLDESGEPIMIDAISLVVPPALEITARNILNATEILLTQAGGVADVLDTTSSPSSTGAQQLRVTNWMRNRVQLVVNPYLPLVITTGTRGHTSWFLFANPNMGRPAVQMDFLRGYETPQILIKSPNAILPGGGTADWMAGSFEDDTISYRVRHILGGLIIDGKATAASNGTGS